MNQDEEQEEKKTDMLVEDRKVCLVSKEKG